MQNQEFIDRYIYAVTKHMKAKMKKDVADELQSIIQDMLEERCGDLPPSSNDIRAVLAELGTPADLSRRYDPNGDKCLIGPPYYSSYLYVIKIVAICVTFGITLAEIMGGIANQAPWYQILFQIFTGIIGGLLFGFAFVTLLFAVFYHKGIEMNSLYDTIDNLPPVPKKTKVISKWDAIFGIVFSVIFVIVFLFCPHVFCAIILEEGRTVPFFHTEYLHATWYFIIAFALLGIGRECVKLIDGMYTRRLMYVTVVTDLLSAALAFFWLRNSAIINPALLPEISRIFEADGAFISEIFGRFNLFLLIIILFALGLDMVTTIVKSLRN